MNEFRDKIKLQNLGIAVCCIILAIFSFLSAAAEAGIIDFMQPAAGDDHWQSLWRGFIMGASVGILALMIFRLVRNILALLDEKKLKQLYVKENDERSIQVWTSARAAAFQTFLLLGIVAAVVSGYFSMTVSITIITCIFCASMVGIGFKVYYDKKY